MSRWTVLFSSVIPASGTRQIDNTFIKGLLTIQDQELCKSHNQRNLRQQYRKSRFSGDKTMVGHLFQNYDTIYLRFFSHVYLQSFLLHDIRAFFCHVDLRSFLLCGFKRAYICAQTHILGVTNKHVVYAVTESRRIRSTELYRQPKTPSCTMELKGNFGLNRSWLQWSR